MELRRLSDYLAVLEHGSIGAAADVLGVSQPGLSKGIRKLERELGVELLDRLPRGVRPTAYGAVLERCATTVTAEMDRAHAEIRNIRDGTGGMVRAGAGPDWLFSVVPRAVASLHEQAPGVQVRLFGGFNDELRAMLTGREVDFYLATLPDVDFDPVVEYEHWITDRFQVIARREHPVHRRRGLTLASLLEYEWVLPVSSPVLRRSLERLYHRHSLPAPEPMLETNYMSLCLAALSNHDYLSWASELHLEVGHSPDIVPVKLPDARLGRRAGLATRRGETLVPPAQAFVARLRAVCNTEFRRRTGSTDAATG